MDQKKFLTFLHIFRLRPKTDRHASMTLVYKSASPSHELRTSDQDLIVVVDSASKRILHHCRRQKTRKLEIPVVSCVEKNSDLFKVCGPGFLLVQVVMVFFHGSRFNVTLKTSKKTDKILKNP